MKPLGLTHDGWQFAEERSMKAGKGSGSAGRRGARKSVKKLVRAMKRGDRQRAMKEAGV